MTGWTSRAPAVPAGARGVLKDRQPQSMTMRKPNSRHPAPTQSRSRSEKEAEIQPAAVPGAGVVGATQVNPSEPVARGERAEPVRPASPGEAAASVDAVPSAPPPEVLEQMAQAQRTYEQLAAQGRSLHFAEDSSGRASVELRDRDGQLLRTLSLAEALDLAAGAPLEP